ncbi:MAG: putative membrane protein YfhO [Aureispira sp.]|jgi:uncharacterized membrane protein YfhO
MKTVFIFLLLIISGVASAQYIQDESYLDSDFWIFKAKLEACLLAEDSKAFEGFLADRILVGKDACQESTCTKEEFLQYHELDEKGSRNAKETYHTMLGIMRFGFTQIEYKEEYNFPELFNELVFQAPSFYTKIDEEKELLILGTNVNIRAAPSKTAKITRQVSYETFPCDCNIMKRTETTYQSKEGMDWVEVKLEDGKVGYVAKKYTSSTLNKEMTIAKIKGEWKIISFFEPIGC